MKNDSYSHLPLMARFAYILMCVETYLLHVYPDRDWSLLAKVFWRFPKWMISDWMFLYCELTPDVVLHNENYDELRTKFRKIQGKYTAFKQLKEFIHLKNQDSEIYTTIKLY